MSAYNINVGVYPGGMRAHYGRLVTTQTEICHYVSEQLAANADATLSYGAYAYIRVIKLDQHVEKIDILPSLILHAAGQAFPFSSCTGSKWDTTSAFRDLLSPDLNEQCEQHLKHDRKFLLTATQYRDRLDQWKCGLMSVGCAFPIPQLHNVVVSYLDDLWWIDINTNWLAQHLPLFQDDVLQENQALMRYYHEQSNEYRYELVTDEYVLHRVFKAVGKSSSLKKRNQCRQEEPDERVVEDEHIGFTFVLLGGHWDGENHGFIADKVKVPSAKRKRKLTATKEILITDELEIANLKRKRTCI